MTIKYASCMGIVAAIPLVMASITTQAATVDQLNRQVQKMNQRIAAQDQRFRVNGFASFGLSMGSEEMAYNGINDDLDFSRFSKLGVQMTFNLDSKNSVVTQLVSRGESNWETNAEWAYFKHQFNNNLSGKIGRIRLPAYMLSEFFDVGYAVPWAKMPNETYQSLAPFANMEGIDLTYDTDIGDYSATVQFAYGRSKSEDYDLKALSSLSASLQADTWSVRAAYSQSSDVNVLDDTIKSVLSLYGSKTNEFGGTFTSLGFTYDPGDIYFSTEYASLEVDGAVVNSDSIYASFGYRMGRWMPVVTFATTESQDDDERGLSKIIATNPTVDASTGATLGDLMQLAAAAGLGNGTLTAANLATVSAGSDIYSIAAVVGGGAPVTADDLVNQAILDNAATAATTVIGANSIFQAESNRNTTRIGLGLRYDMSPGTALKIQYDVITVDDEAGMFDSTAWGANAATGGANPDGTNILTITIDTVF